MKYFLTGATGFVGGVLAKMLLNLKHDVIAVVRNPEKAGNLNQMGVTVIKGDVTDKESMRYAMTGCDGVFHVAGWYKVGVRNKSPGQKINVDGTRNVLELMKELKIPKGVYTSTLAVNSNTQGKLADENYHFTGRHISEYDKTKAAAHDVALHFIKEGLPLVIVMPGLIYGPDGTSLTDDALRLYLQKKLPMISSGSEYCWAHVEDVCTAHILAMEKAATGSTYIICGPRHSFKEAFEMAKKITGIKKPMTVPPIMLKISAAMVKPLELFFQHPEMYASETLMVSSDITYLGDNTKAKNDLIYSPRSLEVGLKQTLEYELSKMKK